MTTESGEGVIDLQSIVDSAKRLGVEIDEESMVKWVNSITQESSNTDVVVDTASGSFGHRVAMLDFSPRELERFRRIGTIVEVTGPAPDVESALAISGSAAQSKIQSFPGDCDYFQRLNIKAPSREEACAIMANLLREKVLATYQGDNYQFLEAKLGSYPFDGTHAGSAVRKGSPISWSFEEIEARELSLDGPDGPVVLSWDEVAFDPGWCKLDWVVSDPERHQLSNASNVIDVTWEAPDGNIVSLDGYLDAFFQEVYLDAGDVPTFAKVAKFVSDDALDQYVERLEGEVRKYLTDHLNYGKAAKRMYNIFRLSGRHLEAAYVRELFDEPATILYQVWSLISTLENATQPGSSIPIEAVQAQADALVLDVISALEGAEEVEIVKAIQQLRQSLELQELGEKRVAEVEAAQTRVINVVNTFFHDKLTGMPTINSYISDIQGEGTA
ncbi:MAG: hypothetical protein IT190_06100 [Microbacteriaceae bacterium]|nr:hypothetical protein [Microbacteriaceae bacterium]